MQKSDYYLKDFVSSFFEFIIIYCFKQTKQNLHNGTMIYFNHDFVTLWLRN